MTFVLVGLDSESELARVRTTELDVGVVRDEGWDEGLVGMYFYVCLPVDAARDGGVVRRVRTRLIHCDIG